MTRMREFDEKVDVEYQRNYEKAGQRHNNSFFIDESQKTRLRVRTPAPPARAAFIVLVIKKMVFGFSVGHVEAQCRSLP